MNINIELTCDNIIHILDCFEMTDNIDNFMVKYVKNNMTEKNVDITKKILYCRKRKYVNFLIAAAEIENKLCDLLDIMNQNKFTICGFKYHSTIFEQIFAMMIVNFSIIGVDTIIKYFPNKIMDIIATCIKTKNENYELKDNCLKIINHIITNYIIPYDENEITMLHIACCLKDKELLEILKLKYYTTDYINKLAKVNKNDVTPLDLLVEKEKYDINITDVLPLIVDIIDNGATFNQIPNNNIIMDIIDLDNTTYPPIYVEKLFKAKLNPYEYIYVLAEDQKYYNILKIFLKYVKNPKKKNIALIKMFHNELNEKNNIIDLLRDEIKKNIKESSEELNSKDNNIKNLQSSLKNKNGELTQLTVKYNKNVEQNDKNIKKLQDDLISINNELFDLKNKYDEEIKMKDDNIQKLQDTINDYDNKLKAKNDNIEKLQDTINDYDNKLKAKNDNIQKLQDTINDQAEEIIQLQNKYNDMSIAHEDKIIKIKDIVLN